MCRLAICLLACLDWPVAVALGHCHITLRNALSFFFFPSLIDKPPNGEMTDDDEIQSSLTNGGRSYFDMDEAFCARMRKAIEAGLEKAPIGIITTPGTKNPKYVPTKPWPVASAKPDMEHA